MYKEINSFELKELLEKRKINLIDIRDSYSYSNGTIEDAKNIPSIYLMNMPEKYLDINSKYYIFCNYGSTSKNLCNFLSHNGYNVVNLEGGYSKYIEDNF